MTDAAELKARLRGWVTEQSKRNPVPTIADDTPIIEERIISSLQVMDLILFLEQLRGRSINVEKLTPGVFRDVNTIYANFLAEE